MDGSKRCPDRRYGVLLFMHSKTSKDTIRHLKKVLRESQTEFDPSIYEALLSALRKGEEIYNEFGGAIFATGTVCGEIIADDVATQDGLHWQSRYYAPINRISRIKPPIHIDEFRDFITISRTGAITKLTLEQVKMLRGLRAR